MSLSPGKLKHMNALSNEAGVIAAAAMDQRGSLAKSLANAKGVSQKEITDEMMQEFKIAVTRILTPHASAILLDPDSQIAQQVLTLWRLISGADPACCPGKSVRKQNSPAWSFPAAFAPSCSELRDWRLFPITE